MMRISISRIAGPAVGVATTLAFWELIGRSGMFGEVWPPLTAVLQSAVVERSGREMLLRGTAATVPQAARGLAAGMAVGSVLALVGAIVPAVARGIGQVAVLVQAVPVMRLPQSC